jgi:hypothetical protein
MIQSDVGDILSPWTSFQPSILTTSSTSLSPSHRILVCRGKFGNRERVSIIGYLISHTDDSSGIAESLIASWVCRCATKVLDCGFKIPAAVLTVSEYTTVNPLTSLLITG